MGEQQESGAKRPVDAWGEPISAERQGELQAILDAWNAPGADHGERKGPFDGIRLTGAEVAWLAEQSGHDEHGWVPNLHLEGADLREAHLERADLSEAHLDGAILIRAHLDGASLGVAHLDGAHLGEAHLDGASLFEAQLKGANLSGAQLKGANLEQAQLDGAWLVGAQLKGANLSHAHLDGAYLVEVHLDGASLGVAHLERADLRWAQLKGANLSGAWLDSKTVLSNAMLSTKTQLGDMHWSGVGAVDLTQLNWRAVPRLGDEQGVGIRSRVVKHEAAVRAYRQLAAQLRAQGMSEAADGFAGRAQVRQRKLLFRQMLEDWRRPWRLPRDLVRWLFSWFLALLAGYGYHPGRSVFWYLATIGSFAFAYYKATSGWIPFGLPHPSSFTPLTWYEALVLSVSSFHGRGFLPFSNLGDPVTILAAIEAVFGLLIEISFIATFTQRFFGSK